MKTIQIYSKKYGNHTVLVDDADYDYLSEYTWFAARRGNLVKSYYAVCNVFIDGKNKQFYMHRLLVKRHYGDCSGIVDHRDGNSLNNQMHNLRVVTPSQNGQNKRVRGNKRHTKFKGVYLDRNTQKYYSQVRLNNNVVTSKMFLTEADAANAYNEMAIQYFGEYAAVNNI